VVWKGVELVLHLFFLAMNRISQFRNFLRGTGVQFASPLTGDNNSSSASSSSAAPAPSSSSSSPSFSSSATFTTGNNVDDNRTPATEPGGDTKTTTTSVPMDTTSLDSSTELSSDQLFVMEDVNAGLSRTSRGSTGRRTSTSTSSSKSRSAGVSTGHRFQQVFDPSTYHPSSSSGRAGGGGGGGRGRGQRGRTQFAGGGGGGGGSYYAGGMDLLGINDRKADIFANLPASVVNPPPIPFPIDTEEDRVKVRTFLQLVAGGANMADNQVWTDYDEENRLRKLREQSQTGNEEHDFVLRLTTQSMADSLNRADAMSDGGNNDTKPKGIYIQPPVHAAILQSHAIIKNRTGTNKTLTFFATHPDFYVEFAELVSLKLAVIKTVGPQQYYTASFPMQIKRGFEAKLFEIQKKLKAMDMGISPTGPLHEVSHAMFESPLSRMMTAQRNPGLLLGMNAIRVGNTTYGDVTH
jgi:hypothetical protein